MFLAGRGLRKEIVNSDEPEIWAEKVLLYHQEFWTQVNSPALQKIHSKKENFGPAQNPMSNEFNRICSPPVH